MLQATSHSDDAGWTTVDDLDTLSELRARSDRLLWAEADVASLTPGDVATIAEEFGLHPLAVEDAENPRQRPKLEAYENHLFVVVHQLDEVDGQLEAAQIACFVGRNYVLSIHAGATRTLAEATRRWRAEPPSDRHDAAELLHVLVDVVVDDYQAHADRLEARVEELEDIALSTPAAPIQEQVYSVKQQLARLRRYVLPGSRLLEHVVDPGDRQTELSRATRELYRDVHDHLLRITDQIHNVDDLTQAVLDLTHSQQAMALNEVTKKLSAWAAIFAVETLIAGIYGMNFRLVPPDQTLFGFWFALALMAVCGVFLYRYFKTRDWM
ncbi:MAG TPA: CorA family divalent cation transporter [Actinomycetota bacterium]|nr:CorA family divalent cation transporter [Actinomycetota bacterium]